MPLPIRCNKFDREQNQCHIGTLDHYSIAYAHEGSSLLGRCFKNAIDCSSSISAMIRQLNSSSMIHDVNIVAVSRILVPIFLLLALDPNVPLHNAHVLHQHLAEIVSKGHYLVICIYSYIHQRMIG